MTAVALDILTGQADRRIDAAEVHCVCVHFIASDKPLRVCIPVNDPWHVKQCTRACADILTPTE